MYTVLNVVRNNPNYQSIDVLHHFETELEIPEQVKILQNEVGRTIKVRNELRVLRAKRMEQEEKLKYIQSDIETEVYLEFPPRKGSEAERTALRMKLQKEHSGYEETAETIRDFTRQIVEREDELHSIETEARNARRLIDLFKSYSAFIKDYFGG